MPTLPAEMLADALARLEAADARYVARYVAPGEPAARQPVHTYYLPAQRFDRHTPAELGAQARATLRQHAPDAEVFADAIGLAPALAEGVYARVVAKLEREPIEDLRLDFEDGYGLRPDDEEDASARAAATELAAMAPIPFSGLRLKTLGGATGARALRTLDLFLATLLDRAGRLPDGFAILLAKITSLEHVRVAGDVLDALEPRLGLAAGALRLDVMVETTQCVLDADGRSMLPALLDAARGRLRAAHLGTYDFTGACGIAAAHQGLRHPACDFAKHMMKMAYAETGVWLSDGSTHVLPVGDGDDLRAAWRLHADDVRHSLVGGYYQGWDLHPAQLPTRFGAVYGFYRAGLAALRRDIATDAGTASAARGFIARGLGCGAFSPDEVGP